MPSISKSVMPGTWVRRLSNAVDSHYNSDGNSSSYSSVEDNQRLYKQYIHSFTMNDDLNGRSYVDPWDMENYSFLRKQLEGINLSENEHSPAFGSAKSDFYYVPLNNGGSPKYHYENHVDASDYPDPLSPQIYGDDAHVGLMANIDEHDFYNENVDTSLSMLHDDSYMEFSNPSRQSERSRFNNQDYHTYTPPSIMKGFSEIYTHNQMPKLRRRASVVTFRPDTYINEYFGTDSIDERNLEARQNGKSLSDVKIKLNRRKSFHVLSGTPDFKFGKMERRKSALDNSHIEKWQTLPTEIIPELKTKEKLEKRKSAAEMSKELGKKSIKSSKEGILQSSESKGNRLGLNVSFYSEAQFERKPLKEELASQSNSSLVYVYETARRRRKMFLPDISSKIFDEDDFRYNRPEIQDVFSLDPIEQYLNRPTSRYTMTSYGHLKIDYSCSWNYLDKCIAQRICL